MSLPYNSPPSLAIYDKTILVGNSEFASIIILIMK